MEIECSVVELEPVTLAMAETFIEQAEVPQRIQGLFDVVYDWLRESPLELAGHNHAIYDRFGPEGMRMRVGVPVSGPFEDTEKVRRVELPGGRAAHARHVGDYGEMHRTHSRLNDWMDEQKLTRGGSSWEVYGDRYDDPVKVFTDIYILLGVETATP